MQRDARKDLSNSVFVVAYFDSKYTVSPFLEKKYVAVAKAAATTQITNRTAALDRSTALFSLPITLRSKLFPLLEYSPPPFGFEPVLLLESNADSE